MVKKEEEQNPYLEYKDGMIILDDKSVSTGFLIKQYGGKVPKDRKEPKGKKEKQKREDLPTTINIDADIENADWTKRTWDLPKYKSKEFMDWLKFSGMTLTQFKKLPVYQLNKDKLEKK